MLYKVLFLLCLACIIVEGRVRICDKPVYPPSNPHVRTKAKSPTQYPSSEISAYLNKNPTLKRKVRQDEKKGWVITQFVRNNRKKQKTSIPPYWTTLCPEQQKLLRFHHLVHHDGGYCWAVERFRKWRYPYVKCRTKTCNYVKSYPWLLYACFPQNFRYFTVWLWCPHSQPKLQRYTFSLSQSCGCRRHICRKGHRG